MHAAVCIIYTQDDGKTKKNSVANIIMSSSQMESIWNEQTVLYRFNSKKWIVCSPTVCYQTLSGASREWPHGYVMSSYDAAMAGTEWDEEIQ